MEKAGLNVSVFYSSVRRSEEGVLFRPLFLCYADDGDGVRMDSQCFRFNDLTDSSMYCCVFLCFV